MSLDRISSPTTLIYRFQGGICEPELEMGKRILDVEEHLERYNLGLDSRNFSVTELDRLKNKFASARGSPTPIGFVDV